MRNKIISIYAGWLIDGSGDGVQSKMRIGLENGTIQSIRKMTATAPNSTKPEMPDLDLSGCTLLPGLIDCHVHLAMLPTARRNPSADKAAEGPGRFRGRILKHLNQLLARGVMAVRFKNHGARQRQIAGENCS